MRQIWIVATAVALVVGGRAAVMACGGAAGAQASPSEVAAIHDSGAGPDAVLAGCPGCSTPKESSGIVHADCDACAGWAACLNELQAAGASMQVVKLKNGVMYVCTADSPAKVRVVRASLARRNERLKAISSAGDRARLCPECRILRGAAVSGKLSRELINIEGGCITVTTSSDPEVVGKIHLMAGFAPPAAVKS